MQDIQTRLAALRRPALLIRAARMGQADYRRDQHLPRLLGYGALPSHGAAVIALIEIEADLDARRTAGDAGWSAARHVEVLIALMAEARLLRAASEAAQAKASGISALRPAT
jgi:alkylhydroperoxidase family enzyme